MHACMPDAGRCGWVHTAEGSLVFVSGPPGVARVWTPRILVTSVSGCSHMGCSW